MAYKIVNGKLVLITDQSDYQAPTKTSANKAKSYTGTLTNYSAPRVPALAPPAPPKEEPTYSQSTAALTGAGTAQTTNYAGFGNIQGTVPKNVTAPYTGSLAALTGAGTAPTGPQYVPSTAALTGAGTAPPIPKNFSQPIVTLTGNTQQPAILPEINQIKQGQTPLVALTAGGYNPPNAERTISNLTGGKSAGKPTNTILQSPDVALQAGTIYNGPTGQVGPNQFVITDLADLKFYSEQYPNADIFLADPNAPGPLRAVGGNAVFSNVLTQYLLGNEVPQTTIDQLVKLGYLAPSVSAPPSAGGYGGGGGGGTPSSRGRTATGGRYPSAQGVSYGLIMWRI